MTDCRNCSEPIEMRAGVWRHIATRRWLCWNDRGKDGPTAEPDYEVVTNEHEVFRVRKGVCLECGAAILDGAHLRTDLPPCSGVMRSPCGHPFPCNDCQVLPPENGLTMEEHYKMYLEYIADQANCRVCYTDGFNGLLPSGFCSKHRSPIIMAQGALYGWNYRGGQPLVPEGQEDEPAGS